MKRKLVISVAVMVILTTVGWLTIPAMPVFGKNMAPSKPKEITAILASNDIRQQSEIYRALIVRVGPVQAQEDLLHSGLPFTGQTHLLNHTVGEYLYETYGDKGLVYCKEYFLSSCYHGFLMNLVSKDEVKTLENLKSVMDYCDKKGNHLTIQCSHAIGHAFLAVVGYANLPDALARCDDAAKSMPLMPAYNCYDGVFMENIWGVHSGEPSPDRWINTYDPKFPCDDSRIHEKYLKACWGNQASEIYMIYHGDSGMAGYICSTLTNEDYKKTCFDALARQLISVANGNIDKMFSLCQTLEGDWTESCLGTMVTASFSVGDRATPFRICDRIRKLKQPDCFGRLVTMVQFFATTESDQAKLCEKITDSNWRLYCQSLPFDKSNLPKR